MLGRVLTGLVITVSILTSTAPAHAERAAEGAVIPFDAEHWDYGRAVDTEFMGRKCLMGSAMLKDFEFTDGVLEMDMAVTGQRAYAGFIFRVQDQANYEHFYIRPHREGLYGDDLQYAPVRNGISTWQLYSGDGYTASWDAPDSLWFHVRLEVKGSQARVFVDGHETPDLVIDRLRMGAGSGGVGVQGQMNGSAYFSNFRFTPADGLEFDPPAEADIYPGMVTDWEVSKSYRISDIDVDDGFDEKRMGDMQWRRVEPDETGMVDVGMLFGRTGREPEAVFARTTIKSDEAVRKEYKFGYSDYLWVFLDGETLYQGGNAYRQRGLSSTGVLGFYDGVYLPLKKGDNELVIIVAETMGGWGFMARDEGAEYAFRAERLWETEGFRIPESVLYDPGRDRLYVTNYDAYNYMNPAAMQSVSLLGTGGSLIEQDWVGGLRNPTGMTMSGGRLYVVERTGVAVIDPDKAEIVDRIPVAAQGAFLNDIAISEDGTVFLTDSRRSFVLRYDGEVWSEWMKAPEISQPNALFIDGKTLYVGNSGKEELIAIDTGTRAVEVVALLSGNIDGICAENGGDMLVSVVDGRLYRVERGREPVKLVDLRTVGHNTADFGYIPGRKTVVIPGYLAGKVTSFRID